MKILLSLSFLLVLITHISGQMIHGRKTVRGISTASFIEDIGVLMGYIN